jgi:hypothetical protein
MRMSRINRLLMSSDHPRHSAPPPADTARIRVIDEGAAPSTLGRAAGSPGPPGSAGCARCRRDVSDAPPRGRGAVLSPRFAGSQADLDGRFTSPGRFASPGQGRDAVPLRGIRC